VKRMAKPPRRLAPCREEYLSAQFRPEMPVYSPVMSVVTSPAACGW
jgi:hypothetical protein